MVSSCKLHVYPPGRVSCLEIAEIVEKCFGLFVEADGVLNFEGILDEYDFEDETDERFNKEEEYADVFRDLF